MTEKINISEILSNAIIQNDQLITSNHILSDISVSEVLSLTDEKNTLKIYTSSSDVFNLDNNIWNQISSNNEEGFSTYVSTVDESIKILIDETVVEII